MLREIWGDVRQLIRIEVTDRPAAPLVPVAQQYFLRENLKLRLLTARIALLARDDASFQADLAASETWLKQYFDVRAKPVQAVLGDAEAARRDADARRNARPDAQPRGAARAAPRTGPRAGPRGARRRRRRGRPRTVRVLFWFSCSPPPRSPSRSRRSSRPAMRCSSRRPTASSFRSIC